MSRPLDDLLRDLRDRGITLTAEGERLRYRAPGVALSEPLLPELAALKAELLAHLTTRPAPGATAVPGPASVVELPQRATVELAGWPTALREDFEERAAILEYDGGVPGFRAESLAFETVSNGAAVESDRARDRAPEAA